MKELGQKRFKGKSVDEALEGVYKLMEGKDPATSGVTVSMVSTVSCLPPSLPPPSLFVCLFL